MNAISTNLLDAVLANTTVRTGAVEAEAREQAAKTAYAQGTGPDIFFPVAKRPLAALGKVAGNSLEVSSHMANVAMIDGTPRIVGIVGKDYVNVPMGRVVEQAEAGMRRVFGVDAMSAVKIIDATAFGGGKVFRVYDFQNNRAEVRAAGFLGSVVGFRLVIKNGYDGGTPVSLHGGTLDLVCLNGAVSYSAGEAVSKRHTKGVVDFTNGNGWERAATAAFSQYEADVRQAQAWTAVALTEEQVVERLLDAKISPRKAGRLLDLFRREAARRGPNAWALASALTHDATHGTLRDTGSDHGANTVLERQEAVAWLLKTVLPLEQGGVSHHGGVGIHAA